MTVQMKKEIKSLVENAKNIYVSSETFDIGELTYEI
jgi:hypothetical protein